MKPRKKRLALLALLLAVLLVLSGCGEGEQKGSGKSNVIKIGYVNPTTGALAGNGEGCAWVVKQFEDYVKAHPIKVDGQEKTIQVIVYDSTSDQNTCSVMTQKLIEEDKVDLMIAIQTPNTVIPVVQVAERYGMPCIATQAPIDPVANSLEEFKWTFNAFYTLDDVYESQRALWTQAGHAPGSGAKVGLLFANDADGSAWHSIFVRRLAEDGYEVVDPGQYPSGTTDFTNVANTFKSKDIDVIAGTNIPPDFMNAYNAIIGAGVEVDCVTMGKCCLLASDVEALGSLADGIMTQVWWAPTNPYSSQLTGISSAELDAAYAKDNGGRTMPQPAAFAYAALELAVHTFEKAGSTDREKVRDAIASLDVDTIVGHIKYDNTMSGLTYARTVLCGGQWQRENGQLVLKVIDNSLHPEIPLTGEYQNVNATKKQ